MRAALANSRVCAALLAGSALWAACAEPARGPLAGASDAWKSAAEPALRLPPVPAPAVWDMYGDARRWASANRAPFMSRGHQPEQQVDVHANQVASASYATLVSDTLFADGSVLVELPHEAASAGSGFAMSKSGGQWTYLLLDARGGVLESGALSLCVGCHSQALADRVFGLAREPTATP